MAATNLGFKKVLFKNKLAFIYLSFSIALILCFSTNYNAATNVQNPRLLEANKAVEEKLTFKEKHVYRVALEKKDFLLVTLEQKGIDIIIQVIDPNGQKLADVNNLSSPLGQEALVMIADLEGDYQLIVKAADEKVSVGGYEIKVQEKRPATQKDVALLEGRELQATADFLYAQNTKENFLEALKLYQQSVELFQLAEDKKGQASCLRGVALCYYSLNENLKSIENYEKSLALWTELGQRYSQAATLLAIGGVYYIIDDYQLALSYYEQALPIWIEIKDRYGEGYTLAAIGNAKVSTGDYFKAVECYYQSIQAYQDLSNLNAEGTARFSLSNAFYLLGELNESLSNYQQTLALFQTTKDKKGQASTYTNLGLVYAGLKNKDLSLENYNKAIALYQEQNEPIAEAFTRLGVSASHLLFEEHDKALEVGNQSLEIFLKSKDKRGEAIALSNIGRVYFASGDKEKAKENYQKAIDIFRSLGYRSGEAAMLYGLASVALELGNINEAQSQIEAALKIVNSPTLKITEQEIKEFNFTALRSYFDLYIDVLMQLHKNNPNGGYDLQAFQVNEQARARFLQDILTSIRPTISGIDSQLLAKERKVNQLIRNKTRSQMKLLSAEYTAEQLTSVSKDLEKFAKEYEVIQAEIKEKYPRYAQLMYSSPIATKDLQQRLGKDTILLEYWLGQKYSYLWLVTPDKVESFELPARFEIEQQANKFHQLLRARNDIIRYYKGKPINQSTTHNLTKDQIKDLAKLLAEGKSLNKPLSTEEKDAQAAELANTLGQILLQPVATKLAKSKLLIVGEGALHFIPFAALINPGDETKKTPLLVDHEIAYLPSALSFIASQTTNNERKNLKPSVAIFADPILSVVDNRLSKKALKDKEENQQPPSILLSLKDPARQSVELAYRAAEDTGILNEDYRIPRLPVAAQEAKQLATILEKPKEILETAMTRNILSSEELKQYSILHFSSYAFINSKHPAISGLALSLFDTVGKEQDNFLRLKDLYNLELPADLVTFSAGGTTLNGEVRAEGFYALSRGLMYSGVSRTMLSLWTVNEDARVELMSKFYQELLKQKQLKPSIALRNAQLAILEDKRWQSPYYWAAFMVVGNLD
ncbi:MAG: CHAT domain-containing protein [Acidobacteria bacterium]|nr:CHAT domain-containing protein [Acidobacteriota bacterium]